MGAVLIVLLAALIAWVVTLGGGGGGTKNDDRGGGPAPATSITPGPGGSGPAISQEPGGRDESGGSGGASGGGGDGKSGETAGSGGAAGTAGSGGSAGSGGAAGSTGSGASAGSGGAAAGTGAAGGAAAGGGAIGGSGTANGAAARAVPAGSTLPTCGKGALRVALSSTKVAYEPDEKPQFGLTVTNTSGTACKVDLGPKAMVLTITNTDDDRIFTSKNCPKTGDAYFQVPAHTTVTHKLTWDRRHSTTKCSSATPPAAGAGTYLAQISSGVATIPQAQSEKSIRLDQD